MALTVEKLRKQVERFPDDPLSRFALGKKLYEGEPSGEALAEAAAHLRVANRLDPSHLATYHVLGQVLARMGQADEARGVLEEGVRRTADVGEGMGRDLGPAMRELLERL